MNWWDKFIIRLKVWWQFNPYKKLWSLIGKRPWTYIARDIYHKAEYIWLVGLFIGGYAVGKCGLVSWKWFLVIMAAYTIGYIHGHFFWGKEYVPDQTNNERSLRNDRPITDYR